MVVVGGLPLLAWICCSGCGIGCGIGCCCWMALPIIACDEGGAGFPVTSSLAVEVVGMIAAVTIFLAKHPKTPNSSFGFFALGFIPEKKTADICPFCYDNGLALGSCGPK